MIKTLRNLLKQDKERFVVPRGVQDVIPIKAIYDDGIFQVGRDKFSKTYKFSDINYAVASREDKEAMFLEYSELLNSLDSGATTKITINNRRLNRANFEKTILLPLKGDALDEYREEYNRMLLDSLLGQIHTGEGNEVVFPPISAHHLFKRRIGKQVNGALKEMHRTAIAVCDPKRIVLVATGAVTQNSAVIGRSVGRIARGILLIKSYAHKIVIR